MRAFLMCSALVTACSRRSCVSSVFSRKFTCCFCSGANPAASIVSFTIAGHASLVPARRAHRQTASDQAHCSFFGGRTTHLKLGCCPTTSQELHYSFLPVRVARPTDTDAKHALRNLSWCLPRTRPRAPTRLAPGHATPQVQVAASHHSRRKAVCICRPIFRWISSHAPPLPAFGGGSTRPRTTTSMSLECAARPLA